MNNTAITDAATRDLALKFRKGSTASFKAKEYTTVLGLIGWKVEQVKDGRSVVAVVFTAPNGETRRAEKGPTERWVTFYNVTPFLREQGAQKAISDLLGLPTHEEETAKRELYGVQYSIENSGLCSCCFRLQKLDANGNLVHHGYERPGYGYIVGDCYGVGLKPLEVSCDGTKSFLSEVLEPNAETAEKMLQSFLTSPPTSMQVTRRGVSSRDAVQVTVDATTTPKWDTEGKYPGHEYREALEKMKRTLTRHAEQNRATVDRYTSIVANWVPDMTPKEREEQGKMPVMLKWIMSR